MTDLPGIDRVGEENTWFLPIDIDSHTEELLEVQGRFIGMGTSNQDFHRGHRGEFASKLEKCGACRWYETRIFVETNGRYVLHHTGASIVPGEFELHRLERALSPHEVIELFTTRPRDGQPSLSKPAARALAQAAYLDSNLRDAYIDRAVS